MQKKKKKKNKKTKKTKQKKKTKQNKKTNKKKKKHEAQRYLPPQSLRSLGLRARYLPHNTPSVPRSIHAKFHHDRIKTMGARGIKTYKHTYIHT